jgi:hypothetical protein
MTVDLQYPIRLGGGDRLGVDLSGPFPGGRCIERHGTLWGYRLVASRTARQVVRTGAMSRRIDLRLG